MAVPEEIVQNTSIVRRLVLSVSAIVLLFVLVCVGLYLSSSSQLRSIAEIYENNRFAGVAIQIRQLIDSHREVLERQPVGGSAPNLRLVLEKAAEETLAELDRSLSRAANVEDPEVHKALSALRSGLSDFHDSADRNFQVAEKGDAPGFGSEERGRELMILRQLGIEAEDSLARARLLLQERSERLFERIYSGRYLPLQVVAGLGVLSVGLALLLGLTVARQIRRNGEKLEILYQQLKQANEALVASNHELESFSYSVSHDLRAPLRSIDGFSQALLEDSADKLDEQGKNYLRRVRAATQRMGQLIDDLLGLAKVTRGELRRERVDLSALARQVGQEILASSSGRVIDFKVAEGAIVQGDPGLMRVVLDNLLGNSFKFTSKKPRSTIEFGMKDVDSATVFFVRDNGAGFDMAYADKLFGVFQRMHAVEDFAGTGIGLATIRRVILRHGGRIWAESAVDQGATFYFSF